METLRQTLATGAVRVRFTKSDGTDRIMLATTKPEMITYEFNESTGTAKPENPNLIRVWDLEKNAWRSIREDRVKDWS